MGDRAILLKQNPRRTVALRFPERGRPVVVKRYHHPGPIARFFDRTRAEQESEVLSRLARSGVRVPAPARARRGEGGWELVTAWIEGAVSLADVLEGLVLPRAPLASIAASIGRLLASAHAAGLDHPDLHPGNLLVQPDATSWIVDVRGARIRPDPSAPLLCRDLVALASSVRERSSKRLRARFLIAYLNALEPHLARVLPARRGLAAEIERRARIHRREAVRRARLRWTRHSAVCRPVQADGMSGFSAVKPRDSGERTLVVRGISWRRLLSCWYSAARLCDHSVASVRPLMLAREPEPFAIFALPRGTRPVRTDEVHVAMPIDTVHACLRDRGLALDGSFHGAMLADADGSLRIGPLVGARLRDCDA